MRTPHPDRCVLGLASMQNAESAREPLSAFVTWIGERAQVELGTRFVDSYGALAKSLRDGSVDIAWLPPVVFVALHSAGVVEPLVSNHRGGQAAFHAVLVVHADAKIHTLDGLRGARAAWVDPYSASGYVMPRIQLAAFGVDPRISFAEQRFLGSHDAVIDAVVDKTADVAGTFARVDGAGLVSSGSWSQLPRARSYTKVLATFGNIPADVIGARAALEAQARDRLMEAFVAASFDRTASALVRRLFGVEEFRRGDMQSYASLGRSIASASERGLLDDLTLGAL
jgi:phosphate/phosphite/phosphonate ABC transporter binding protein